MKNLKRIIIVTLVAIIMSMATTFAGPKLPSGYWYYDHQITPDYTSLDFEDTKKILLDCYWSAPNMGGTIRFTKDNLTIYNFGRGRERTASVMIRYDSRYAWNFVRNNGWNKNPAITLTSFETPVFIHTYEEVYGSKTIYKYYMYLDGVKYTRSDHADM